MTTEDVAIAKNGPVRSLDRFIGALRELEAKKATVAYELSAMETTVEGATAQMTYTNSGVAKTGDSQQRIR